MKIKFRQVLFLGMVVTFLAAISVSAAGAASTQPIMAENIKGDPDEGNLSGPSGNSWVNYDTGTCVGKCRLDTHIPGGASGDIDQVPHPKVGSLYMQTDGDGGYSACFSTKGVDYPQVWQYIDGQWIFLSSSVVNGMICVRGHGTGAFALFGYTTPPTKRIMSYI